MWRATARKCLQQGAVLRRVNLKTHRSLFSVARTRTPLLAVNTRLASLPSSFVRCFSDSTEQKYEFQAETKKLLDIVTHSIYTDKEVFLRELISNASDSLEKLRFNQVTGKVVVNDESPLQVNITVDPEKNTLTIYDNGIGMTKDELVSNLGTIARSGSKQFVESLKQAGSGRDSDSIIGQFGVGFYSSFMVSDSVTVESVSATEVRNDGTVEAEVIEEGQEAPPASNPVPKSDGHLWASDGSGDFTISKTSDSPRGSKITLHLKESCKDFCDVKKVKDIIKKYSNFVPFPILVDGVEVNTVSAIWAKDKNSVTSQEYNDFYKYVSNSFDKPKYTLHFSADAPIDLKALIFFPTLHTEKFGMGRMEPAVSLYSRKVLIENKPADLLPSWLRFLKGVVDSEDLPLSIAREKAQDTLLLGKIRDVLTRKIIRHLSERLKRDEEGYVDWYKEFHMFIKEGICMDQQYQDQLAKLLMFETSQTEEGDVCTLDEYISRCPPEQKNIYYMMAPDRKGAFSSPYYETFKAHNKEVLFLYNSIDDFVMSNLKSYSGRPLKSAEDASIDLSLEDTEEQKAKREEEKKKDGEEGSDADQKKKSLIPEDQIEPFCTWLKETLGEAKVREIKTTSRLSDSPAIITDHESGAVRRMMKMVDQNNLGKASALPPQVLHINPKHPIVEGIYSVKDSNPALAALCSEQLLDNAAVAAGLMDDVRLMVPRLNDIIASALKQGEK